MPLGFLKRRKERHRLGKELETVELPKPDEETGEELRSEPLLERVEQILENAREIDDGKKEYRVITSYLNDIEIIENLAEDRTEEIRKAAESVARLNEARDQFLNTSKKISDAQFQMIQQYEDDIPEAVKRFRYNEDYQAKVKRDMQYLEGEKQEIETRREEWEREQSLLRTISRVLISAVVVLAILLLVLSLVLNMDVTYAWIAVIAIAFVAAAFILIRLQNIDRDMRQADVNRNYAITLLNKVKIKYVNITNAVDYTCEKYHVRNSKELSYQWDMYQQAVREQAKYRQTNEDLNYYYNRLVSLLGKCGLYDSRVWLEQPQALTEPREMVEIKHNLLVRRKKLRSRIAYNLEIVKRERKDIDSVLKKEKEVDPHLLETLRTIDELADLGRE